jgi:ABC-type transport system involved in multi-copper enzyme maturation permease subunit
MIRQILRKELLMNLLSLRFLLSLLLAVSLFTASSFVFVNRYEKNTQDYWKKTNENLTGLKGQSKRLYRLAFYKQEIYKRPKPLTCFVEGYEKSLPDCIRCDAFMVDLPEIKSQSNFILPSFSDIDWVFIVSVILSFVALVFTYDSICGEKETGTLKLMLAGTVPRFKVILGKYFAAMLTLGIPLCIGLLVSLIIILFSRDVILHPIEWLKILSIVLLSLLCLSAFVLLGIFMSIRTAHSSNSMVVLLLVWVGLVILIPSFGRIVSDMYSRNTTRVDLLRKLDEATEKVDDQEKAGVFGENAGIMGGSRDDPMNNPPARARYKTAGVNARSRVIEEHHRQMLNQVLKGRNLTCLSPVVIYRRASETIAGTGVSRCAKLRSQIRQYMENLLQYIRDEDSKDTDSLHLICPDSSAAARWKTISHNPVGFAAVPKFQERELALGESLKMAIWDIGLLVLFNLVFFAASFVSFLRYDVR